MLDVDCINIVQDIANAVHGPPTKVHAKDFVARHNIMCVRLGEKKLYLGNKLFI